jgi:hypothetical protein
MPASLFFLTATGIFLLGMSAFLGYSNLEPVRKRLYYQDEQVEPGGRSFSYQEAAQINVWLD